MRKVVKEQAFCLPAGDVSYVVGTVLFSAAAALSRPALRILITVVAQVDIIYSQQQEGRRAICR